MKKASIYIIFLAVCIFAGCNNNTYSNALKEEEKLIENFIKLQGIQVVNEEPTEWGDKVYWKIPGYDNYYFHLVERGDTTKPALKVKDNVLIQYIQYTLNAYADTIRYWNADDYQGATPQIQFTPANMMPPENACTGWLIALEHMKYTGAECKIICPSKLGFTNQNSNVIPYGFDMKIKIKRF